MTLPQFLLFATLTFLAIVAYFIFGALLSVPLGMFAHIRLLSFVFGQLVPIAMGLVIAGGLGAWRQSTHVAYQALAVFISGLMIFPAHLATAYLGIRLCAVMGGCFD